MIIWIPESFVTFFWFMFGMVTYFIYVCVVYISLDKRTAMYCNCGRDPKLVIGAMHYFARTSLAGPSWAIIVSAILFSVRMVNAWFIGYHLQLDTQIYDTNHVIAFVCHGSAEILFVMFFLILFTTSSDCCRYLWLFVFAFGQYALFIVIMVMVSTDHPRTFYCALANIIWLTILDVIVFIRELVNNNVCGGSGRHRSDGKSSTFVQTKPIDTIDSQSLSAHATVVTSATQQYASTPTSLLPTTTTPSSATVSREFSSKSNSRSNCKNRKKKDVQNPDGIELYDDDNDEAILVN